MRSWSIRTQMFLVVLCVGLPLVSVIAFNVWSNSDKALANAKTQTHFVAAEAASSIEQFLDQTERYEALLAQRPLIRALDPTQCDPLFARASALFPEFDAMTLYDTKGLPVCGAMQGDSVLAADWYKSSLKTAGFYLSDVYRRNPSDPWGVTLSYPVRDVNGATTGVLAFHASMSALQKRVIPVTPSVVQIGVLDRNARFAFRTLEPERWIGQTSNDAAAVRQKIEMRFAGFDRQRGIDGILRVYGYRVIPKVGWLVGAGLPEDEVFAFPLAHVRQDLLIAVLALLLAMFLARRLSRSILKPVQNLSVAAGRIANGEGRARAVVEGTKEVAVVAQEFNRMLDVRDQADLDRQAAEERYQAIFNSAQDAIITIDDQLEIVQFNPAAEAMFMIAKSKAQDMKLDVLIPRLADRLNPSPTIASAALEARGTDGEGLNAYGTACKRLRAPR